MGLPRLLAATALATLALAACSSSSDPASSSGPATPLEDAGGVSPGLEASTRDGDASRAEAGRDAGPDVAVSDGAVACPALDRPVCTKAAFSDSACSMVNGGIQPYGCLEDIGTGCTELGSGTGWCCPNPAPPPACSGGDPFCASVGAAACGLTSGCNEPKEGCRAFRSDGVPIWCCQP